MKQKKMPTGNSDYGRVLKEDMETTVEARDNYSTAEIHILSFEAEGYFLSVSEIKVATVNVSIYEDGFDGSPEDVIFE